LFPVLKSNDQLIEKFLIFRHSPGYRAYAMLRVRIAMNLIQSRNKTNRATKFEALSCANQKYRNLSPPHECADLIGAITIEKVRFRGKNVRKDPSGMLYAAFLCL
jgi:hypothetical protein